MTQLLPFTTTGFIRARIVLLAGTVAIGIAACGQPKPAPEATAAAEPAAAEAGQQTHGGDGWRWKAWRAWITTT